MSAFQTRSLVLSISILVFLLGIWEMSIPAKEAVGELTEYEILMGGAAPKAGVPPPSEIFLKAFNELSEPIL